MRKKLLRSRSGFEKPESREEAIMQNILGASNVLEPSESNIEEILKSILYNTPYSKEAEFEIEKILLAIKNNGTYDCEGESRDMKILLAILRDSPYNEEAESRIEELFIEWLYQRSSIKVLEGVPPLTFVAKGNPLINCEISGNTVQSGTPTPDNPIMPQGTGDRTGNLCPDTGWRSGQYRDGVWETTNTRSTSDFFPVSSNQYRLKINAGQLISFINFNYFDNQKQWLGNRTTLGMPTFSPTAQNIVIPQLPSNAAYMSITIRFYNDNGNPPIPQSFIDDSNIMVSEGTSEPSYEPYGIKIPILSTNTTTPIYLGEVESTRRVKKLVLTGQENFFVSNNCFILWLYDVQYPNPKQELIYCTHYKGRTPTYRDSLANGQCMITINQNQIAIKDLSYATADNFKAYLAAQYANGTPVTIWYVLATEETAVINEPLMRIGTYADTLSKAQAGVQIPTNNGTTVIDVNTTVKPSNIYIEYK